MQGFPRWEREGGLGVWRREWVPPPYIVKSCWFPHVMDCTPPTRRPILYIKVCSPHHLSESPHQWVSLSCPIVCRRVSFTKSLPCPLHNKFFAILYKVIGKFASFNMFHQTYSWHPTFCSLTVTNVNYLFCIHFHLFTKGLIIITSLNILVFVHLESLRML